MPEPTQVELTLAAKHLLGPRHFAISEYSDGILRYCELFEVGESAVTVLMKAEDRAGLLTMLLGKIADRNAAREENSRAASPDPPDLTE